MSENQKQRSITAHKHKIVGFFLFLGVILFFLWLHSDSEEIEVFIPVELGHVPSDLALIHLPVKGIEVRAYGPKYLIQNIPDIKQSYILDLSNISKGKNRIEIQQTQLHFPDGITIAGITPAVLTLEADKAIQKEVPVMVSVTGKPAKGYVFSNAFARPPSVILRGPESVLAPLEKIMTKTIDINGISESLRKEIALDLEESLVVESPKNMYIAEVFIEEKIITKAFDNIQVEGANTSLDYSITPSTINIEIRGPLNILEKIHSDTDIRAYLDLKTLTAGVYARPVIITLPLKTTLNSVNPEIFTVTIK